MSLPFEPGVAGVDEAGRGPLAGPLVVAAVVLPSGFDATGLDDSKRLTSHKREVLYHRVIADAAHSIVIVEPDEIDRLNILRATLTAMSRALSGLPVVPKEALIDGNAHPIDPPCPTTTVVKGDGKFAAIAAASILAKVTRDRIMAELDTQHSGYGFADHHGYCCPGHLAALQSLGPSPIHRRSFEPVKSMVNQPCLMLEI